MTINVGKEVAALERLTVTQLREKYAAVFGEATTGRNKVWLVRRIAWRLQAAAAGGLSERARRRAAELANDADIRSTPPPGAAGPAPGPASPSRELPFESDDRLPPPGSVITRRYKGEVLRVEVRDHGFVYAGEVYASLSAVAKAITGSHCNGFLFFRLTGKGGAA